MRLEPPFVLGLATSASSLWSVTYYTATDCSGAGKELGGYEAGCWTLGTGTESVKVSTDSGNNITLSTDSNCGPRYENSIQNGVTDHCVNAAIRSFLSY
ncbi:unnamed protein product [Penicillium nalgiovense]|nr:unnamed protein product [Penicillium nalgiovense]CAG8098763.1 unnamed protein product [Penicillium nalgiovense]CAG8105167.1 unnamed protein product [Penicillium nalgiovense]CAG8109139.1 unnamed protein product [Penicillium nalgiovense]CAG8125351.1 unnamed protein product [Penicillium nalgiovense]